VYLPNFSASNYIQPTLNSGWQ